jgi:protein-disulfide isomerase
MGIPAKWAAAFAVAALFVVSGCADPQEISEIKAKVDELQASQKDIVAKLEGLSKGQQQILAKAPAAPQRPPQEDPNKVYTIPAGDSYAKGPADAPVVIVEFSDFQCPFCSQAAALIKQVTDAYPKDVRFIYKNYPLPFHKEAMPAAKAAIAAGKQGKFWEMHDKLFENKRSLNAEFYAKTAQEIGLDVEKFKKDMEDASTQSLISEEMKQAQQASVRGTPTVFINGKKPQGRSFELYKSIIDEALKEKKAG